MIKLCKMTKETFNMYIKDAIDKIAQEYTVAGVFKKEDSYNYANETLRRYLPNGYETPNQFLLDIINDKNEIIGLVWYSKNNEDGFICDFYIDEEYRGMGFENEALRLLEEHARKNKVKRLSLQESGHNQNVINLYEKSGYKVYSIHMAKDI